MTHLALQPAEPLDVLVIDDDPQYVRSITRLLGVAGCVARGETDVEAGIALAKSWQPDVALIDYFMPALTGDRVIERIRVFDQRMPCIVVSGYAGEDEIALQSAPYVQGLHGKSQEPRRLIATVQIWGRAARALRAAGGTQGDGRHSLEMLKELLGLPPVDRIPRAVEWRKEALGSVATFRAVFEGLDAAAACEVA